MSSTMSSPSDARTPVSAPAAGGANGDRPDSAIGKTPLWDISSLDLDQTRLTRTEIESWNPHRGVMALLDAVVWVSDGFKRGVGRLDVRGDEFWAAGHFPKKPMMPGVLQVEAGAQLSCYLYNCRQEQPRLAALTRLERAVFRADVTPPCRLVILAEEVKYSDRRFVTDIQGLVNGEKIAFEARINGLRIGMMSDLGL